MGEIVRGEGFTFTDHSLDLTASIPEAERVDMEALAVDTVPLGTKTTAGQPLNLRELDKEFSPAPPTTWDSESFRTRALHDPGFKGPNENHD